MIKLSLMLINKKSVPTRLSILFQEMAAWCTGAPCSVLKTIIIIAISVEKLL